MQVPRAVPVTSWSSSSRRPRRRRSPATSGRGYVVESSIGHIRDLPAERRGRPGQDQGRAVGPSRRRRRQRLHALLRRRPGQEAAHDQAQGPAQGRRRALPRHRRGPRGRGDRLAPARRAEAEGAGAPDGLPRDHPAGDRGRRRATRASIDMDLVDAQETRRILDRLYGYEVSPVLWKKVMSGLSAGRVQSVATRLVVDRERERMAFRAASYWDLEGTFDAGEKHDAADVPGRAVPRRRAQRVARGSDFDRRRRAEARRERGRTSTAAAPRRWPTALRDTAFDVRSVEAKPYRRQPYAPFRTTTLQQEASRKLGFGASRDHVGRAAALRERLHHLHAHRLDDAVGDRGLGGPGPGRASCTARSTCPDKPRTYASQGEERAGGARGDPARGGALPHPGADRSASGDEFRLYELIWMRTVASQMKDAEGRSVTVRLGRRGRVRRGRGVLRVRPGDHLPRLPQGVRRGRATTRTPSPTTARPGCRTSPRATRVTAAEHQRRRAHQTKPPARYTEATLVRELEEREIGRPSTYASIIGTILNRGYVYKKGTALVPAWLAFSVDPAARGALHPAGELRVHRRDGGRPRRDRRRPPRPERRAGRVLLRRRRRRGAARSSSPSSATSTPASWRRSRSPTASTCGSAATAPTSRPPTAAAGQRARGPAARRADRRRRPRSCWRTPPGEEIPLGADPESGLMIVAKNGRYGPYVTEVLPEDAPKSPKPRTGVAVQVDVPGHDHPRPRAARCSRCRAWSASTRSPATRSPRRTAATARTCKKGTDSRSIDSEEQLLTITARRGAGDLRPAQAAWPRRAADPRRSSAPTRSAGARWLVKDGRFGPYVTDGEYNATLRQGDDESTLTLERAAELLAERRAKGPAKKAAKKGAKKTTAKKTTAKKTTAKKTTAKKTAAKKTAAKKTAAGRRRPRPEVLTPGRRLTR